jgi:hypothetical protein
MGQTRRKLFIQVLEDIKKGGNSSKETEQERE